MKLFKLHFPSAIKPGFLTWITTTAIIMKRRSFPSSIIITMLSCFTPPTTAIAHLLIIIAIIIAVVATGTVPPRAQTTSTKARSASLHSVYKRQSLKHVQPEARLFAAVAIAIPATLTTTAIGAVCSFARFCLVIVVAKITIIIIALRVIKAISVAAAGSGTTRSRLRLNIKVRPLRGRRNGKENREKARE